MSDTHQDEVVDVHEDDYERERREARERAYQDVSLRAVELLANAQRAADEAVAEAQSYARDLEETAREQYRVILQRANEAARSAAGSAPPEAEAEEATGSVPDAAAPAALAAPAPGQGPAPSAAEAQQLEYVRTYARVAHSQLRAVLGALNDELDKLAELAQPDAVAPAPPAAEALPDAPAAEGSAPDQPGDGGSADEGQDPPQGHHVDGHEDHEEHEGREHHDEHGHDDGQHHG